MPTPMSLPGWYPAARMASMMKRSAASFDSRSGANPPSSPTAVLSPCLCRIDFSAWNVSAPICTACASEEAPKGMIMNSWKSRLLAACAPPLMMFIMGIGNVRAEMPPR